MLLVDEFQKQCAKWKKPFMKGYVYIAWFHSYDILERQNYRDNQITGCQWLGVGGGEWLQRSKKKTFWVMEISYI